MNVATDGREPDAHPDGRQDRQTVEVAVETAHVDKVRRLTGRVSVATTTESVEEMVEARLDGIAVEVMRVPVDRVLAASDPVPTTRQEGGTTIVPVFEEILVVEKRLVLREEIRITQHATSDLVQEPVTLRRQRVDIDRQPAVADEPPLKD